MRKTLLLLVLSLFGIALISSTASAQTLAGYMLTNVCKVTANNLGPIVAPSYATNVATRTMFGGSMGIVSATARTQTAGSGQGVKWDIIITNYGNATAIFRLRFEATNRSPVASTWKAGFQNGTRSIDQTIAAGGTYSFSVCVTDTGPLQANGDYWQVRINATNRATGVGALNITALNGATNYVGDNGVAYGGNMGDSWTGVVTPTAWKQCYLQTGTSAAAGYLTFVIAAPVLNITKSIQRITKGGVASAPIPGATIQYRIFVTNSGDAPAVSTRIVDTTPSAAVMTFGATIGITNLTASDIVIPNLAWSNQTGSLAAGGRAVVIYTVRIN